LDELTKKMILWTSIMTGTPDRDRAAIGQGALGALATPLRNQPVGSKPSGK